MLHGKVKAAVRWVTEQSRGVVLSPDYTVDDSSGRMIMDVLHQKHPVPRAPVSACLIHQEQLPLFEDVEITGTHILYLLISFRIVQGQMVVMPVTRGMYCCVMEHIVNILEKCCCCPCSSIS